MPSPESPQTSPRLPLESLNWNINPQNRTRTPRFGKRTSFLKETDSPESGNPPAKKKTPQKYPLVECGWSRTVVNSVPV